MALACTNGGKSGQKDRVGERGSFVTRAGRRELASSVQVVGRREGKAQLLRMSERSRNAMAKAGLLRAH